jgi:RNA polymerase sigma-70 factor (ECF subfamily)
MAKDRTAHARSAGFPVDEALLIEQARSGDMAAFSRLVTRYQDRILNTCWRVCGHLDDAQDLTQEAFVKAMESIGSFRQQANFYTWLYRIAVNLSISHRRKRRRAVTLSLHHHDGAPGGDHQATLICEVESPEADPQMRLSNREMQERAVAELDRLDDEHRTVIVLRDIESMNYDQIAAILEVPIGTVKSRLHRARLALRDKLRPVVTATAMKGKATI